jgi:hypothetical protein
MYVYYYNTVNLFTPLDIIKLLPLQEYEEINPLKNWNIPKAHTHKHAFDDIENKGVSRNYNTKPNEKAHQPLKDHYLFNTNFKDVGQQVNNLH